MSEQIEEQEATQPQEQQVTDDLMDLSDEEFKQEFERQTNDLPPAQEPEEPEEEQPQEEEEIDYKAFYDEVTSPIKADGRDFTIKSASDLRNLVSKGLDYTQKTQQIGPYRKTLAFLRDNDVLDDTKLSYMVDLYKKDEKAVKQLIRDVTAEPKEEGKRKLELYDLDPEQEEESQRYHFQNKNTITDEQLNFREVFDEVNASEGGNAFLNKITQKFDQSSLSYLYQHPESIKLLYKADRFGQFDQIMEKMQYNDMIHPEKVQTENTITRFMKTGQSMPELFQQNQQPTQQQVVQQRQQQNRVKSASIPRASGGKSRNFVDPLDMSDEEFKAQFGKILG